MKLGSHELGPFALLDRTKMTFYIPRGDLVESENCDLVTLAPAPYGETTRTTEVEEGLKDATPQDLCENNSVGRSLLVKRLMVQLVRTDGIY